MAGERVATRADGGARRVAQAHELGVIHRAEVDEGAVHKAGGAAVRTVDVRNLGVSLALGDDAVKRCVDDSRRAAAVHHEDVLTCHDYFPAFA